MGTIRRVRRHKLFKRRVISEQTNRKPGKRSGVWNIEGNEMPPKVEQKVSEDGKRVQIG